MLMTVTSTHEAATDIGFLLRNPARRLPLDEKFSDWGESSYFQVELNARMPLQQLAVVEVIEHLDAARLAAFERVLFECAKPKRIVITTPNREYNVKWQTLPAGKFRHCDHRFEWTRAEFQEWAKGVADRFGYGVRFLPVGPDDSVVGSPTQMGVFASK